MELKKLENKLKKGEVPEEVFSYISVEKTEGFLKNLKITTDRMKIRVEKGRTTEKEAEKIVKEWTKDEIERLKKNTQFLLGQIRFLVLDELMEEIGNRFWLDVVTQADWYFPKTTHISGGGYDQKGIIIVEYQEEKYNIPETYKKYIFLLGTAAFAFRKTTGWRSREFDIHIMLEAFIPKDAFEDFYMIDGYKDNYINLKSFKLEEKRLY